VSSDGERSGGACRALRVADLELLLFLLVLQPWWRHRLRAPCETLAGTPACFLEASHDSICRRRAEMEPQRRGEGELGRAKRGATAHQLEMAEQPANIRTLKRALKARVEM
jgi:hypothetical protein